MARAAVPATLADEDKEMIHPIPSGTRDVLPQETGEVRAITDTLRRVFDGHGYGEIYTPALEYESVLARADMDEARPAYRVFDETGAVLVLRSDMTVPIARVVATRYADSPTPLRFCYFAHTYRGVRPRRGQLREMLQAGIELIGAPAPEGTAQALSVLSAALEEVGLRDFRIGMGDASLFAALMESLRVDRAARAGLLEALVRRDFVELDRRLGEAGLSGEEAALLLDVPQRRGGPELLTDAPAPVVEAVTGMRRVHELLAPDVAERVIFDLGLVRNIGYYTGAVFEVYDPALGAPIGGGGRYDDLLGRFGRPLPAVGFALYVDSLHHALAGEERGTGVALFAGTVDLLAALGIETDELRANDRKLLFEEIGVITMRPSDVPTYVEAGAADIGVTGKDVLLEQLAQQPGEHGRDVYELLDLGFGRCTMVLASEAGEDPALESLRRLGVMRVATKYPRIAARHLEQTGRQGEIVEVKGSVELAPLTGMVDAIVDLTASGKTLRENNLVVREEIVVCTARLIANPVAHKLKAAEIDALVSQLRAMAVAGAA
jgi:ATP phosphoribosyltransferase regulatory subunit